MVAIYEFINRHHNHKKQSDTGNKDDCHTNSFGVTTYVLHIKKAQKLSGLVSTYQMKNWKSKMECALAIYISC